jgi:integrase
MGSLIWRESGKRLVVQWYDVQGERKQETIRSQSLSGEPLSKRTLERDGRRRLAEHELEVDRQRAGLSPISSDVMHRPLAWLVDWWWDHRGKTLKSPSVKPFIEKHLGKLLETPLSGVTTVRVEKLLNDLAGTLRPKSRKHLRGYLFSIYELARKGGGPWYGHLNPIEDVAPIQVPKVPRYILQSGEMAPVLDRIDARWRGPVALALYAGLREGEIFGLRKVDVDLDEGLVMVARSWDAPRTKDGKALPVPIASALRPYLEFALRTTPGELVFPRETGEMHPRDLRLGKVLRRAIAGAGLVSGFEWRCRAWGCEWKECQPSKDVPEICPRCGHATTWAKPLARPLRFHDTRHSFGTQLVRAAGLKVAQAGLRHSDGRLTSDTYSHLDLDDLRQGMLRAFPATPPAPGASPGSGRTSPNDCKTTARFRGPRREKGAVR